MRDDAIKAACAGSTPTHLPAEMSDITKIFTLRRLERILNSSDALDRTLLAKASDQTMIAPSKLTPKIVLQALDKGASLKIEDIHLFDSDLECLREKFYKILDHPCRINCYLTPPTSQCFPPHFDDHDVFIIQVQGEKLWTVDKKSAELYPIESRAFQTSNFKFTDSLCLTLHQGEGLYIPMGHVHQATTSNCFSLHLTIGVHKMRAVDYFNQILTQNARREVESLLHSPMSKLGVNPEAWRGPMLANIFSTDEIDSLTSEVEKEWNRKKMLEWRRPRLDEQIAALMLVMKYDAQSCSNLLVRRAKHIEILPDSKGVLIKDLEHQVIISPAQWIKFSKIYQTDAWIYYNQIVDDIDFMHTNHTLQGLIVKGLVECRLTSTTSNTTSNF